MHYLKFLFIIHFFYVTFAFSNQPEVTIEQGVVRGLYKRSFNHRKFSSFEGIPYAAVPENKYRFKEPVPANPWLGIYNATKEPPKCLQFALTSFLEKEVGTLGSEDCLYLNIYTPKFANEEVEDKLLDVIAFIHGGGFTLMYSTIHDPTLLLDRNVILVTFNYRLGPLGFLSTEDSVLPGNNGLKDQVLALKWIQKNIAAFGGDPKSVTLAGISAGSISAHLHLLSPLSRGLFKGAICMSGTSFSPLVVAKDLKKKALVLANELGCPEGDSKLLVECLRSRPAEHMVSFTTKLSDWYFSFSVIYGPIVEPTGHTSFISDEPLNILKQKGAVDVPLLLSFTADEGLNVGAIFNGSPQLLDDLMNHWDEVVPVIFGLDSSLSSDKKLLFSQKIKKHYKVDNSSQGFKNLIEAIGDVFFLSAIGKAAKLHASLNTSPVYIYKFSYRGQHSLADMFTKENLGVSHGDDAQYLFGSPLFGKLSTDLDIQMSKRMVDLWVSFAANGTLENRWKSVNEHFPRIAYTDIQGPNDLKSVIADEIGEERFWDSVFPKLSGHDEL